MTEESHTPTSAEAPVDAEEDGILAVRRGHGANCSSIGSAVEMLFLSATVGAAVLAAVAAALSAEADQPPESTEQEES